MALVHLSALAYTVRTSESTSSLTKDVGVEHISCLENRCNFQIDLILTFFPLSVQLTWERKLSSL